MGKKIFRNIIWLFVAGVIVMFLYPVYLAAHQNEDVREHLLSALLEGQEEFPYLRERIKVSDCEPQEPLPDKGCTPGAVFDDATKEDICISGYSKTVRNVPESLRKKVFAQYGIDYPVPFGSYEVDHLIPLSLGGSNDIANLWPKSAGYPGFYEKNITGNYLLQEVCAGRVDLDVAQERIADNWTLIYENLDPKTIRELKARYANWADRAIVE